MPSYDWVCKKCERTETLIVPMSESDRTPENKPDETCAHEWHKQYLAAPQKAYGPNWGWNRKGSWLVLLTAGGIGCIPLLNWLV